jgi:hypothetical protein
LGPVISDRSALIGFRAQSCAALLNVSKDENGFRIEMMRAGSAGEHPRRA